MAIYKSTKEFYSETADPLGSYLVDSMDKPTKNPSKFLYRLYNLIEKDLTTKQLKEISSLGRSSTNIEVPLTEVREKPSTPFITRCTIEIYKRKEGLETKYININKRLDYILMPLVAARLFLYIDNTVPDEEKDRFHEIATDWIKQP